MARFNPRLLNLCLTAVLVSPAWAAPVTYNVYVFNNGFSRNNPTSNPPTNYPTKPIIKVGDTIRWVRISGTHDVVACAGQAETFNSGVLTSATPFLHTFTHTGDFNYFCSFHGFDAGNGQAAGMASTVIVRCSASDVGMQGGVAGQDKLLDNNDFVVFIAQFFNVDDAADIAAQGGLEQRDGVFDNNDLVVFINRFFADAADCHG